MATSPYEIVFTADTATAISAMERLEQQLKEIAKAAFMADKSLERANSSLAGMATQAGTVGAVVGKTTTSVEGMNSSLLNLSNGIQVLSFMLTLLGEISEKFNHARDQIKKFGDEFMEIRDSFNEVASLQGKDGPDDEVVANVLKLGVNSGLLPKEANEFMKQFEGSVPAGKQKKDANGVPHITDPVATEVAAFGARFGVQQQISPKTAGDFAGVMGQYQKIPDVATAARVMGQVTQGLKAGRGSTEDLMRSLINTAGGVVEDGGAVNDLGELGVLIGVASTHANPDAAGTQLRQSIRSLREVNGPQGEWLAANGVKPGMGHVERLKAVRPALLAEAAQTGEGLDQIITRHITTNAAEARSIAQQIKDVDLIDTRLADKEQITGPGVIAGTDRYFAKVGAHKLQGARKKGQELLIGHTNEQRQLAMENAQQMMIQNHEVGPTNTTWETINDFVGLSGRFGRMTARDETLLARATGNLIDEARRKGMTEQEIFGKGGLGTGDLSEQGISDVDRAGNWAVYSNDRRWHGDSHVKGSFDRLSKAVERRGGNVLGPAPDVGKQWQKVAETQQETNRILKQIEQGQRAQGKGPAAGQFQPVGPPRPITLPPRPGGAMPKRP